VGYLVNSSASFDFTNGLTLSAWLRIPTPGDSDGHIFFEFGNNATVGYPSSVSWGAGGINCIFAGKSFAHPHLDWFVSEVVFNSSLGHDHWGILGNWDTIEDYCNAGGTPSNLANVVESGNLWRGANETTDEAAHTLALASQANLIAHLPPDSVVICESRPSTLYDQITTCGGNWHTPYYNWGTDGTVFPPGSWHHVLIAVNCSGGIVDQAEVLAGPHGVPTLNNSLTKTSPFNIIIDGVDALGPEFSNPKGNVFTAYGGGEFDVNMNPTGSGIVAAGYPVYLPCNPSPTSIFGINGGMLEGPLLKEYGDFQVFNKYIDPTIPANYERFVTVSSGVGRPASFTAAAQAFGTPVVAFHGKASDSSFYTNHGSAGTFTKNGTASDFTPTPTYG
jgi:hypothetical protein